jgi:hypothetical protein
MIRKILSIGVNLCAVYMAFTFLGIPVTAKEPLQVAQKQANAQAPKIELRWGTITAGGAWQVVGSAMLEDIKKANPTISGSIMPSSTTANVLGVHQGKFNIGFSLSDTTADAWQGEGYFKPYGKIQNIRNLFTIYPQTSHIVVSADSNITKIEQLKGKRITPGAKGLSNDLELQRLLKLYGLSYNDFKVSFLSFDDAAQQFIDGHIDGLMFLTVTYPYAPVLNVNAQRSVKFLSIPDEKIAALTKFQGVESHTMPPGIYKGQDYPVKGIAVRSHVIVRSDMPDEVAYVIVKTVMENFKRYPIVYKAMEMLKQADLSRDVGIPFHPGALKYYKEKGLIK